jgi:hypothetical protein
LELNENGKLLAVIGDHDVAIVVLPVQTKYLGKLKEVK